ncbi:MAG: cyclic nucleotide-binding domain-containing protein [Anaerolineales bacterium]|nr:cyclic nucleotide-binding domain-containing protein [Anaerolineales bacterium]
MPAENATASPPATLAERVALLKELALFRDLSEADTEHLAARFIEYQLGRGQELYEQGELAENLYIVLDGHLRSELVNVHDQVVASGLQNGDVFGARNLKLDGSEVSRVKALHSTRLLYLPRRDLERMLQAFPTLAERMRTLAAGRSLKPDSEFEWLGRDESIQFVMRKHPAALWLRLARVLLLAIVSLLCLLFGLEAANSIPWLLAAFGLLLGAGGWAAWEYLDWTNDFYVLTDQRVVWLEQKLLRSASRVEAPLETVQSVNTHTTLLGRILGFGDVMIQTFTSTVSMPKVGDPLTTKFLVEEYVLRQRRGARVNRHDGIRQAVRESLGTAPHNRAPARPSASVYQAPSRTERMWMFPTRTIDGDKIIYHKHWAKLFSTLIYPVLAFAGVLWAVEYVYSGLPSSGTGWLIMLGALLVPVGFIVYHYVDWQNDIYMLTPESLMDSEKKPLGSLITKTAPLANVLSLENHRIGLLGLIFNFGIVRINVGDSWLDFDGVHDPAQVQQDIFSRIEAFKLKTQKQRDLDERSRMAEWLKVYEEERTRGLRLNGEDDEAVE